MHMTPFGPFRSCSPEEMREMLQGASFPWWIAGGWAIDLFLGRQTRAHEDIDVEVPRGHLLAVREHFASWDMQAPHDALRETAWPFVNWAAGNLPPEGTHQAWCRPSPDAPWVIDLMFANIVGDVWHFRRNGAITVPMAALVRHTEDGTPYVAPEVQLLYKSKGLRAKDQADFALVLPLLAPDQKGWLLDALRVMDPEHEWIAALGT